MPRLEIKKLFIGLMILAVALMTSLKALADISAGLDGVYFSDSSTAANNPMVTKLYYDASFYVSLYNKSNFYFGAAVMGFSSTDKDSSAVITTWSAQDYGFSLKYFFGRQKTLSLVASYLVSSTANYKLGTATAEIWTGTGVQGKISYQPLVFDELYLGISMVYYGGTYKTSQSGSTYTIISKTRTYIVPTVSLSYNF